MSTLALLYTLIPFAVFNLGALLIPGLDFVTVSRTAVFSGKKAGLFCALGVSIGCVIWGLAGFLGIHALFTYSPHFYWGLKIGGAIYLIYMGIKLVKGSFAKKEISETVLASAKYPFLNGLFCNLANPKAAILTSALFASAFPKDAPLWLGYSGVLIMFVLAFSWFSIVAFCLTTEVVRVWFQKWALWIDRVAGGLFIGLGAWFVAESP